jgi:signal transduction histidine kinase
MQTLLTVKLAHNLQELLTIIADCADSIRTHTRIRIVGVIDKEFDVLDDAIDSAFAATRELLTLGQPNGPNPSPVDVNDLLSRAHGLLRQIIGPGIQLVLDLRAADAVVEAQDVHIEWLLMNLVANGRDAMPKGGILRIETDSVDEQRGAPRSLNAGSRPHLRVSVTDTGDGVDPAVYDMLFAPFVSTHGGKIGFGLTAAATTVRRLKGTIRVHSSQSGTKVDVYLPIADLASR